MQREMQQSGSLPSECIEMQITNALMALVLLMSILGCSAHRYSNEKAFINLSGQSEKVKGLILLRQSNFRVRLDGWIMGLSPGKHGFHLHTSGDVFSNGCNSTGPHYNPRMAPHGSPQNAPNQRHVGDLGNIVANQQGIALIKIFDHVISLSGPESVIGRAIVVHAAEDNLTATANSGARIACGVIKKYSRKMY
ncbi:uncharacterized protein LOC130697002 isoform X2 [Daphnia carinata]|uniref:uncharacterized protein LOC130697002 isoform X2 n=1 Tax=Daphnia carinata TaxID=120202 RepID=UPI00257C8AE2|nr:uncharacterized protein LOC130697002 isoform X2 [Daphnia carinata]